ncbi:MAG: hypothetical protein HMLKMBBP_01742 [Planctomycetes bacterium]|nr:hypothetical protein [Planctomycetota bacterium]
MVEFLRGRVLTALGRHDEAVEALEAAARGGLLSGDTAGPLRRTRVAAGRILDAVDGGLAYAALAGEAGEVSGAWEEVRAARDAFAATAGPAERIRLARAMSSVGWIDEARTVASPAARDGDPEAAALCAELAGFRAFLDDVAAWSRDARRRSRAGDDDDADDAMTVVRNASTARLGLDLTEGASERSYPLLGSFACSTEGAGAFRDVPSRFGMVLVVGGRSGRAADVVAGRLVALRRGADVRVLDRTVRIDEHVIDAEGLPEGVNGLRTGLAGITLDDVVLVQIDSVLRTPRPADAGFPLVERAAASRGELLALDTPSEVSRRIEESLPAGRRREELLLDAVRRHERVHAMDAADMLPILAHPLRNLAFALSHGFGAESMEQTLEGRAALLSIVDADDPRAALAALVSFLPAREGDAPHAAGYRRMTEAFLLEIARDPASFPSVRAGANLLQQLDRLGPDEVREAARRAVDREF